MGDAISDIARVVFDRGEALLNGTEAISNSGEAIWDMPWAIPETGASIARVDQGDSKLHRRRQLWRWTH